MGLRVLLTDANPVLLSIYRAFLVDQHLEVRTASSARECLEVLRQWRPALLVLDTELPDRGSLDVLAGMQQDDPVPVLLISRESILALEEVALRDYAMLIKPVPPTVLADIIRTFADPGPEEGIQPLAGQQTGR
jgi:DNA-binding NtrC family response regulator